MLNEINISDIHLALPKLLRYFLIPDSGQSLFLGVQIWTRKEEGSFGQMWKSTWLFITVHQWSILCDNGGNLSTLADIQVEVEVPVVSLTHSKRFLELSGPTSLEEWTLDYTKRQLVGLKSQERNIS
jgi:hypothetical protein